jgi:hypothetical protein
MDFTLSTKDNPLAFFDELYTIKGMKSIEREFHNTYYHQQITPYCKYVEENLTYHLYEQCNDDGDYEMNEYSFIDFLGKIIFKQRDLALASFKLRMKSCNGSIEQQFALKICIKSIKKYQNFLNSNDVLFKPNHIRFIGILKDLLIDNYEQNDIDYIEPILTKITSDKSKEELLLKIQNSLQIFSGMDDFVTFKNLVLRKKLPLADEQLKIMVNCELWVFKELLKRIKPKFDLSWKNFEIEASGIFRDAKKNKLITAKRLTDAVPKSTNKKQAIFTEFDKIFQK